MRTRKQSIENQLSAARVAINNALDDQEIKTLLNRYGYDEARIQAGKGLLTKAEEIYFQKKTAYGKQYDATGAMNETWREAHEEYIRFVKIARVAFQDEKSAVNALGLSGERSGQFDLWLMQARHFYQNALATPGVLEGFARYNITAEDLLSGQALLEEAAQAGESQEKQKGAAQTATREREEAFEELHRWLAAYLKIARIALEANPQQLEKLGITVKA